MRSRLLAVIIAYLAAATTDADDGIHLYSKNRRSGLSDQFFLQETRLEHARRWNPQKRSAPPLSTPKAISIARKYLATRERAKELTVESVALQSIDPSGGHYYDVFYYRVNFGLGPFDHPVCIVLMDGSVVEPTTGPFIDR